MLGGLCVANHQFHLTSISVVQHVYQLKPCTNEPSSFD